jgi:hypothetical protein
MVGFTDPDASYGDGRPNDTAGWSEIDLSVLRPDNDDELPYKLVVNRYKSSSPDSEAFIHDPLSQILKARDSVPAFADVDESWHVSTFVINHHRTLSVRHVYAMVTVSAEETTVGVTIYKENPGS